MELGVKKFSQLFFVSCPTYPENFMKIPFALHNIAEKHASRKILYPSGYTQHLKMLHPVPCAAPDLSCKSHENPFTRFSVMLLTDTDSPTKWIEKNLPYPKCSTLFHVSCRTYPGNFLEIHSFVSICSGHHHRRFGPKTLENKFESIIWKMSTVLHPAHSVKYAGLVTHLLQPSRRYPASARDVAGHDDDHTSPGYRQEGSHFVPQSDPTRKDDPQSSNQPSFVLMPWSCQMIYHCGN